MNCGKTYHILKKFYGGPGLTKRLEAVEDLIRKKTGETPEMEDVLRVAWAMREIERSMGHKVPLDDYKSMLREIELFETDWVRLKWYKLLYQSLNKH